MKLSVHPYFLEFIHPFALAHGVRTGTQLAFVKIELEGIVAYGEASLPPYRKETFDSVKKWVESQYENVEQFITTNPFENPDNIPFSSKNPSASAALQAAILNWHAESKSKKLTDFFIKTTSTPELTLTITKNDYPFLPEKLRLVKNFSHFKIKLTGSSDDLDFVKAVRKKTNLPFCIDINQGYFKKEEAILLISNLEKQQCILIEQPLGDENHEGHYWLKQRTHLPIIADESICLFEDLVQFHEAYSGVNIKLMKCGGLFQAQKMLQFTPLNNTNFMKLIGCMSESSLGVAMASVLASQCKMADLDAPYLNKNDPFEGFHIINGKIELEDKISLIKSVFL
ncbi:MAG: hypothetical protein CO118_04380 [Flavobacteriales bacterium CG_4_9_14_3_um_filter_32_8]|nr:MAG: hypothetical protein CO118_04380 [Flavobacteriales bacterium CG_4_9_14_3_um_filter_32_8]